MPLTRAFGLVIDSDLALPELPPGEGQPDVVVRTKRASALARPDFYNVAREGDTLVAELDGIRFEVEGGEAVTIHAPPGRAGDEIRAWLLGTVSAALIVQRGRLPLHANAVALDGGAAAFVGPSGAGKSTLAAMLAARGHDILCDDICAIDPAGPAVHRGIPRVKLWDAAVDALGVDRGTLEPVVAGEGKWQMPLAKGEAMRPPPPLQLKRIYLLEVGEARIEKVTGAEAARLVLDNAYRWEVANQWHGGDAWIFERCLDLARQADVYRFARPLDFARSGEALDLLEAHLARG
ncbi:hypothetical protein [Sphingomicrobium nitratireducens]|uniref:hypothetical protein n=1 Tax=Sphingomicrobium nitratireducens TaxID=2964666 RepID=UPI002240713F|nr:hypothetical protein [Sphingomicrobium nitratireducens]